MALTDTFVRRVKHTGKPTGDKHTDGAGMYLLAEGRRQVLAFRLPVREQAQNARRRTYPEVTLAKARQRREKARELLADGRDPSLAKRVEKHFRALFDAAAEVHKPMSQLMA